MATYAIGDIQGCYDELRRLLDIIRFDPGRDKLWLTGDLVNRGPKSLQTLRFVKSLGNRAISVLGNHDLHLLAISQGNRSHSRHGTMADVLGAPDLDDLIEWLRHRPLMHHSKKRGFTLVHAGLPPQWDIPTALKRARELESVLRGPSFHDFCHNMYGNKPDEWSNRLTGIDRLRFITNCFTRLRYCTPDGRLSMKTKGAPGSQKASVFPWFEAPNRASRHDQILFGHWSTLGYRHTDNVWALDSGCLWGGPLTALKLRKRKPPQVIQYACPGAMKPGEE